MKAVQLVTYGEDGLQVNSSVEKPTPKQGQVLVMVKAASINSIDWKIKLGYLEKMIPIQLPKTIGAYVATTVGTNDIQFAKDLGADEVIDFKTQKFEEMLKEFDAAYDTVGGQIQEKSFLVLKKGGILLSMNGKPSDELA